MKDLAHMTVDEIARGNWFLAQAAIITGFSLRRIKALVDLGIRTGGAMGLPSYVAAGERRICGKRLVEWMLGLRADGNPPIRKEAA